jgi:hypothetical protein
MVLGREGRRTVTLDQKISKWWTLGRTEDQPLIFALLLPQES